MLKIHTHDVAIGFKSRLHCFIYDLGNYLIISVDNTHSAELTVCKDILLIIGYLSFYRNSFGFAIYKDRKLDIVAIYFVVLVINTEVA